MEDLNSFKKLVDIYSGLLFKISLLIIILASFFLFTNLTTEIYETPKFLVLLTLTGLLLTLLMIRFTVIGKVVFVRTPLDIPLLLLLAVGIASTILSPSPYVSLLGNQLKINGSLISLIVYVLFYFIIVNSLRGAKEVKWLLALLVGASQILAVITLLSYAGVKILPVSYALGLNFTPTGSSFSTSAVLALLLPFVVFQILNSHNLIFKIVNALFLALMGATIALTGTTATWVAAVFGLVLTFFTSDFKDLNHLKSFSQTKVVGLIALIASSALIILVIILSFIPPLENANNPIYNQARSFPREIQLGFTPSWKISVSAFRDSPIWGTGSGTYLFDFTNYKPVEFNATKIWNLRFDSSFNEYLQTLATLGGVGILALLSLTALFASSAYRALKPQSMQNPHHELRTPLAIAGLVFFVILLLHTSTLVVWVIGLLILAAFMVVATQANHSLFTGKSGLSDFNRFLKIAGGITSSDPSEETIRIDALPGVLLTISFALIAFAFFFGGKFVLADYHHRLALNAVAQNQGIVAYNELIAAEKLNPYNDLYRTDLAQTNFALANAIATAKAPNEASPGGSLTDQDKQNIQILLSQSISEARTAVTLSPKSATNWEILALLYRQISGVAQNALVFSLDAYGRAVFQDPLNPQLRVNIGGVYYAVKSYDMAIRFFTDAINLKPDFANAYYNLSVALRDKGDLTNAQAMAEKTLTLLDQSSQDYKTAENYLADLKNRIGSGSAQESAIVPPAAEENTALQKKELPKVIELPKPENIATPEAIEKPESAPTPAPTTSPVSPTAAP